MKIDHIFCRGGLIGLVVISVILWPVSELGFIGSVAVIIGGNCHAIPIAILSAW